MKSTNKMKGDESVNKYTNLMWVEKYRPKMIEQVVNQKDIIKAINNLKKNPNEMPHLLFAGPAGVGKTTTALCLANELLGDEWRNDTLELNASDERGIKMVRERVKEFAAVIKLTGISEIDNEKPFRIIILDEADEMTSEAQTALRRIIEDSSKTTRFIIICNYLSQIIEPIQSRCAVFRFKRLSKEDVVGHLQKICKLEKIQFEEEAMEQIFDSTYGDLRHSINILQTAAGMNMGHVTKDNVNAAIGLSGRSKVGEIVRLALNRKFNEARVKLMELIHVYGMSEKDFLKYAFQETFDKKFERFGEMAEIMAEYDYRLVVGAHPEIQLVAFLAQLGRLGNKEER